MVCFDICQHTEYKFEEVKQVDKVATVREQIEVLAAQKELQHCGEDLKKDFVNVFSSV